MKINRFKLCEESLYSDGQQFQQYQQKEQSPLTINQLKTKNITTYLIVNDMDDLRL